MKPETFMKITTYGMLSKGDVTMTESEKQVQAMMDIAIPLLPCDGYGGYVLKDFDLVQKVCQALYNNNYVKLTDDYIKYLKYSGIIENYVNREAMIQQFMEQFQIVLRNAVERFLRDALKVDYKKVDFANKEDTNIVHK